MNFQELQDKKDYLNGLRPFSKEELMQIKKEVILSNTYSRNNSYSRKYAPDALTDEEKISIIENDGKLPIMSNSSHFELGGIYIAYESIIYKVEEENKPPYFRWWSVDHKTIKNMNSIVLDYYVRYLPCNNPGNGRGQYRHANGKLKDRKLPSREAFLPMIDSLLRWYHQTDKDFFTKLAIFHLIFLDEIHPFVDGNGRTARMLMNTELALNGYPMIGLKHSNGEIYDTAFDVFRESGDYSLMLSLIYNNVNQQLNAHIDLKKK